MVTKEHFLKQVKKLNTLFPETAINVEQATIYYEMLSPDFNDEQFDVALNIALKNSFKFPPIAAFYKKDPDRIEEKKVYEPVTAEE